MEAAPHEINVSWVDESLGHLRHYGASYEGLVSCHHMCRFSLDFFKHHLPNDLEFDWRVKLTEEFL